jgi:UDP-N-acetyl-D-glucosamine dehydrogenase
MSLDKFLSKVTDKSAKIGIYGLGYVGFPLAYHFAMAGFDVIGFDVDDAKINAFDEGRSFIKHIPNSHVHEMKAKGFTATKDFSQTQDVDALILCVPTPLNEHREPDLSYVTKTLESITPFMREDQIISLESTTWPGTTEEVIAPLIEAQGYIIGENYFLVYSPEREDPGNPHYNTKNIPKVLGGHTPECVRAGTAIYKGPIDTIVPVSSTKAAELTKLLENIHRAVNIGLVNETKIIADKMGIDIHEVVKAAASKPFGFVPYYPGPGIGGHCIPIDPFYLTWKAKKYGVHTRFIELAGEINSSMPEWVVNKTMHGLNQQKKAINGSNILICGVSYKRNIDDMRESPSLELMDLLIKAGANIEYWDPYIPTMPKVRKHDLKLSHQEITPDTLKGYDAVVIATPHDTLDLKMLKQHSQLIIDTRGCYHAEPADNIIAA